MRLIVNQSCSRGVRQQVIHKKNQLPLLLETDPDWDDVEDDVEPVNIQIGLKGYDGLSRVIHRT